MPQELLCAWAGRVVPDGHPGCYPDDTRKRQPRALWGRQGRAGRGQRGPHPDQNRGSQGPHQPPRPRRVLTPLLPLWLHATSMHGCQKSSRRHAPREVHRVLGQNTGCFTLQMLGHSPGVCPHMGPGTPTAGTGRQRQAAPQQVCAATAGSTGERSPGPLASCGGDSGATGLFYLINLIIVMPDSDTGNFQACLKQQVCESTFSTPFCKILPR